ncbi:MAG: AAA family ATPase [Pyrinomonadaceae bacterium]
MNFSPRLINFTLLISVLYILFSIIYFLANYPFRGTVILLAIIPLGVLTHRIFTARKFIDSRIQKVIGNLEDYSVYTKSLPGYRFVDIFNSAEAYAQTLSAECLESQHAENLTGILNGEFYIETNRFVRPAEHKSRSIGVDREGFYATDCFWLVPQVLSTSCGVIRIRTLEYSNEVSIEVAAKLSSDADEVIRTILENASANSIYKNKIIEISFQQEVRDEYGGLEMREKVDPLFISQPPVTEAEIVLDDDTRDVIQRTIIDFHERREELMRFGLPARRGVLFYGPPGTGKTFTSRFISNKLESATTVVTSGLSLLHIRSVCNIARMLQPSVIVLEDVDLVYSSREINYHNTALGELMDELDGFKPDDKIIFILTTNSIERVESAIRERPGRISQCIYFGPPTAELRKQYLDSLLKTYDLSKLDINEIVEKTDGSTQAFLKELVYRSIQFASEGVVANAPKELCLDLASFDRALAEMRKSAGNAGEAIIGFQIKR